MDSQMVRYTVPEFALLVGRTKTCIRQHLRDGKIKGSQTCKGSAWRIPDSELEKWWGDLYGTPNDPIRDLITWALSRSK
jgi:excisionase family DNA binding protein